MRMAKRSTNRDQREPRDRRSPRIRMIVPTSAESDAIRRGRRDFQSGRFVYPGVLLDAARNGQPDNAPSQKRQALASALASLQSDHFAGNTARVKGHRGVWCRVVGTYRIFYMLDADKGELKVLTVRETG